MDLSDLELRLKDKTTIEQLRELSRFFQGAAIFTTSFGIEDQVITHMICENNIPVSISTLDTGRLFPQTYKVFNETIKKYRIKINVFFPDSAVTEKMVTEKGPFSFYYSRDDRMECCKNRKVNPLKRALMGKSCWISGIRADQSENRAGMTSLEYDEERRLFRYYPLFDWSFEKVREYISLHQVPYNTLHDSGFVSIGCEPCTRAVKKNESFRSGRWWWESGSEKECGLHIHKSES